MEGVEIGRPKRKPSVDTDELERARQRRRGSDASEASSLSNSSHHSHISHSIEVDDSGEESGGGDADDEEIQAIAETQFSPSGDVAAHSSPVVTKPAAPAAAGASTEKTGEASSSKKKDPPPSKKKSKQQRTSRSGLRSQRNHNASRSRSPHGDRSLSRSRPEVTEDETPLDLSSPPNVDQTFKPSKSSKSPKLEGIKNSLFKFKGKADKHGKK